MSVRESGVDEFTGVLCELGGSLRVVRVGIGGGRGLGGPADYGDGGAAAVVEGEGVGGVRGAGDARGAGEEGGGGGGVEAGYEADEADVADGVVEMEVEALAWERMR